MRPNMRQCFLKGSFHLFAGRLRSNLRGHDVQMLAEVFSVTVALKFKSLCNDMGKVALGRHTGGSCLGFQRCGILFR